MAETTPFILERGFMAPNFFEGAIEGREISAVFMNPAGFPHPIQSQVAVDASQNFLGYNRYAVAGATSYRGVTLGAGYSQFSADDIAQVPLVSGEKAEQSGVLSDAYRVMVITAGVNPRPGLTLGARLGAYEHELAGDTGKGYSFEAGVRQAFLFGGWVGVYSRYLAPMTIKWQKSSAEETVPREWVMETGYTRYPFSVALSADSKYRRAYGEWAIHKRLSVTGDTVWDDSFDSQRMSLGTVVDFGGFALSYLHLHYTQTELAADQDVVGLLFRFR